MGSFPNKVAGHILKSLFVDKDVVSSSNAVPGFYTRDESVGLSKGLYAPVAAGVNTTPLYIGLIAAGTSTTPVSEGTSNLSSLINDVTINSAGTVSWPVLPFTHGLKELTGNLGLSRQPINFRNPASLMDGSNNPFSVVGPTVSPISFGTANASQPVFESVIGFFITTLQTAVGSTSPLPTIVAYGTLSSSRRILNGDNPTFAVESVSISLQ